MVFYSFFTLLSGISCPQTFSLFWLVSPSPLSKTKLPTQPLYKYKCTLKKNLDNTFVANPQRKLYLFLPWDLGCWPNWPDCGLRRRNAEAPTRHSMRLNAEKGAFLTHVCYAITQYLISLSLRVRLCLWLHFLLTFKTAFMTKYQKFTPKSSLPPSSHTEH